MEIGEWLLCDSPFSFSSQFYMYLLTLPPAKISIFLDPLSLPFSTSYLVICFLCQLSFIYGRRSSGQVGIDMALISEGI